MSTSDFFGDPESQAEDLRADLKRLEDMIARERDGVFVRAGEDNELEALQRERAALDLRIEYAVTRKALRSLEKMAKKGGLQFEAAEGPNFALEAIIKAKYRPALVFDQNHKFSTGDVNRLGSIEDGSGRSWRELIAQVMAARPEGGATIGEKAASVARIQHSSGAVVGTGWAVMQGADLKLMSNRHVVRAQGWFFEVPGGGWQPIDNKRGELNYNALWNASGGGKDKFDVFKVQAEPGHDASMLSPDDINRPAFDIVRDIGEIVKEGENVDTVLAGRLVAVIGHPSVQGNDPTDEVDFVFGGDLKEKYKRFMPGRLQIKPLGTYANLPVLQHDCSTLRGSSGSCVIDLGPFDSDFSKPEGLAPTFGKVIGLHFGGAWSAANYAVPTWELVKAGFIS